MISTSFMKRHSNTSGPWKIAAVCLAAFVAAVAVRADDWPFVRRDTLGSGVATSTVADPPEMLWTYRADKQAGFEATAVVSNGIIYVGDDAGTFHAVRLNDGAAVWTKTFEDGCFLSGAALDGNHIFVGDANGIVRSLRMSDGEEVWSKEIGAEVYAGPTVQGDSLFVTCEAGALSCLNTANGEERWQFRIDAPLRCTPTIVAGHILLAGCDSKLHRIAVSDGTEVDTLPIDAPTGATAAARENRAYFGTEGGSFYAIEIPLGGDKQPAEIWTYRDPERNQPIRSAAAVGERLVVYGAQSKAVYALDRATGQLKWKLTTRSRVDSSPVIAGERVVAATDRGVLYVLDRTTGEVRWQFDAGGGFTASPIIVENRIVIGNTDGALYCFGASSSENKLTTETQRSLRSEAEQKKGSTIKP
jgi:outer membrane protein assembly factor BamB